jgi:hypothetical protein
MPQQPEWWDWELELTPHETSYRGHPWEVIVEPDSEDRLLVLVTAYRVEPAP